TATNRTFMRLPLQIALQPPLEQTLQRVAAAVHRADVKLRNDPRLVLRVLGQLLRERSRRRDALLRKAAHPALCLLQLEQRPRQIREFHLETQPIELRSR